MRRVTLIVASIVSVLVIGYGGWLSVANAGDDHGSGNGNGTSQTDNNQDDRGVNDQDGKPGENK